MQKIIENCKTLKRIEKLQNSMGKLQKKNTKISENCKIECKMCLNKKNILSVKLYVKCVKIDNELQKLQKTSEKYTNLLQTC